MDEFTLELCYRLPVYQHVTIRAASIEDACRLALETQDWDRGKHDYDCIVPFSGGKHDCESSGPTFVAEAWHGADAAYQGQTVEVPLPFREDKEG